MIKAQYISDPIYFRQHRIVTLINLLILIILCILNLFELPVWFEFSSLLLIAAFGVYAIFSLHKFYSYTNKFLLIIEENKVQIKDPKGKLIEAGELIDIENLYLEHELDTSKNSKRIWSILKGKNVYSRLRMNSEGKEKNIYFWVDSHYQLNQFKLLKEKC